jgi:hypothetical protein
VPLRHLFTQYFSSFMKNLKTNPVKTVLTISVGFLLIYVVTKWKGAIFVSLMTGLIGICSDYLSQKIDFLWMKLTWLLSLIVPNILLGIIFYLFLFPISVLSGLFGKKNSLHLKNKADSVFITVNENFDKTSFEKSW